MQPTSQQISELRSGFLKKLSEEGGDSVIHPVDLERAKTSDDWLRRFLLHHDLDLQAALKMMWETCEWRKQFGANDLTEDTVRKDYLIEGSLFSHSKDVDDSPLMIFKCKMHVKGQKDFEELKKCVVYWLERLEREFNGKPISVFFDMEGCGLSNMDMEYTKYLIHLLKTYYPFFLNYIIIYEMAWILNAAFKIIKSLLPEKAVAKMKFCNKSNLKEFVPAEKALKCWGGQDDYIFSFLPENRQTNQSGSVNNNNNNKKVHFADGSPMSESAGNFSDKNDSDGILSVSPNSCISFLKDGAELSSIVTLTNVDEKICITYKMKTTSPEKFRVRPSAGCLSPGQQTTICVTLQPGFQLGGLSRDKFLVMSMPVDSPDIPANELADLWRSAGAANPHRPIYQHKLRCAQPAAEAGIVNQRNGVLTSSSSNQDKIGAKVGELSDCQAQLHSAVKQMQLLQLVTMCVVVVVGVLLVVLMRDVRDVMNQNGCGDSKYKGV